MVIVALKLHLANNNSNKDSGPCRNQCKFDFFFFWQHWGLNRLNALVTDLYPQPKNFYLGGGWVGGGAVMLRHLNSVLSRQMLCHLNHTSNPVCGSLPFKPLYQPFFVFVF
jgi:hypothetical protein